MCSQLLTFSGRYEILYIDKKSAYFSALTLLTCPPPDHTQIWKHSFTDKLKLVDLKHAFVQSEGFYYTQWKFQQDTSHINKGYDFCL